MSDTKGLYAKYIITKADGTPVNDRCFILKPDKDPAAVKALQAYAAATDDEQLRSDLYAWVGKPMQKPLTLDQFKAIYPTREDHVWPFDACPPYLFLESAIEKNDFCWLSWGVAKIIFEDGYRAYSSANYGEKWRFWTSKPTDEERSAAEWASKSETE